MRRRSGAIAAAVALGALVGGGVLASGLMPPSESGPEDGALVGFYGDSYTLGTGASDFEKRWSTIVSKERGWREFNPSVNGLGFVNNRMTFGPGDLPDQIIRKNPEIVFVTMGLNDNFTFDRSGTDIRDRILVDLERLSDGLPSARIIVVEPFWYTDRRPASVETIIGWAEDGAESIGADFIPGASRWIEGHPEWMAEDGLHPNDEGYAEIARRMDRELTAVGL
jgi:lysophospholipase L1-like esterase